MAETTRIMIVAGEASGDKHAAKLVSAMREICPMESLEFFGAAGPKMRDAGVTAIVESDNLSIVGIIEIAKALPIFLSALRKLIRSAREREPIVVILVDFPDFNLKLARLLKKAGHKVVYYISPQLWAWRQYRVSVIRNFVDLLIVILPFEKEWYRKEGVTHVTYVGNPLAREVLSGKTKEEFCTAYDLDPANRIVALLPGSRHKEIARILPAMLEAAVMVETAVPDVIFLIAVSSVRNRRDVESVLANTKSQNLVPRTIRVVEGETYEAIAAADAAAVTSGTATLETGILGTPMVIVYKTSSLNYTLLEPLISVEHYGLINLIAGERLAKELIQSEFTAAAMSAEILKLLESKENIRFRRKLAEVTADLGKGGASRRAAEAIVQMIKSTP